jgi:NhaP-type Na+/H+ or K+/H+ antiporter
LPRTVTLIRLLGDSTLVHSFETAVVVLGGLLVLGALVSGVAHRSFLSLTALFVVAGFILGHGGFDVLEFDPRSGFVKELAIVALIVILFRDGLEVEAEMLQRAWHLPLRNLAIGMPVTAGIIAVVTKWLTDLSWTESFLLGALLSPTDPVLSSSVVTNPRVPRLIRHSLNLESGLNDGLALAPVLALAAALRLDDKSFTWWTFVIQDVGIGVVFGLASALLASVLLPREGIPDHQRALYGLGVAFAAYGITTLPPHGNGVIAVFVAGITLGIRRPDIRAYFETRTEDLIEIVKLGVFVVFGSLLTFGHLFGDGWAAVAIVAATLLVARPVALWVALAGTHTDRATKAFMAWFGPKGVATMTFSLLVLSQPIAQGERIFNLAALVVFCSILAHGLTDHPGVEWIARRSATRAAQPALEPSGTRTSVG